MPQFLDDIRDSFQLRVSHYDKFPEALISAVIGLLAHFTFIFLFYFWEVYSLAYLNIISTLMWGWATIDVLRGYIYRPVYVASLEILLHATCALAVLGNQSGFDLYLWPLALWLAYHPNIEPKFAMFAGPGSVLLWTVGRLFWSENPTVPIPDDTMQLMLTMNSIIAGISSCYIILSARLLVNRQSQKLTEQAIRDKLTGLYNRHYLISFIEDKTIDPDHEQTYSLILADIDHFKRVNDNFGHDKGDSVLAAVADHLRNSVRNEDLVCRWGGEEFIIVMKHCDLSQAVEKAESIRVEINNTIFADSEKKETPISLSFGVTQSTIDESFETALSRADKLLYQAKESGRNRVVADC